MRALRIHLKQTSANYRREETVDNKMTYPLPPYSTVIGAIHKACNYTEYHEMELSIQGSYGSMGKEVYLDHCFLNSLQNDRGILVKMCNESTFSKGYIKVAAAKKAQGNDFRKGVTIEVLNQDLLDEYRNLKDLNDEIGEFKKKRWNPVMERIKARKKLLADLRKAKGISEEEKEQLSKREKNLKSVESKMKQRMKAYEEEHYQKPISYFRTLTTGPKYYEVLYDVELIIHVYTENQDVLNCIYDNIDNLTSLGRSEDFVQVEECEFTELQEVDDEYYCTNAAYVQSELLEREGVYPRTRKGIQVSGTRYLLNKNYELSPDKKKRLFHKMLVAYVSDFSVDEEVYNEKEQELYGKTRIYIDKGEQDFIVNLV